MEWRSKPGISSSNFTEVVSARCHRSVSTRRTSASPSRRRTFASFDRMLSFGRRYLPCVSDLITKPRKTSAAEVSASRRVRMLSRNKMILLLVGHLKTNLMSKTLSILYRGPRERAITHWAACWDQVLATLATRYSRSWITGLLQCLTRHSVGSWKPPTAATHEPSLPTSSRCQLDQRAGASVYLRKDATTANERDYSEFDSYHLCHTHILSGVSRSESWECPIQHVVNAESLTTAKNGARRTAIRWRARKQNTPAHLPPNA